jgi:hypothetical protein
MSRYPLKPRALDEAQSDWSASADAPVVHALSVSGVVRGDHDLAARSQEILRRELGHSAE